MTAARELRDEGIAAITEQYLEEFKINIEARLETALKAPLSPAIWLHALKVCGYLSMIEPGLALEADVLHRAFALLQSLEEYLGLYELYLRLV